MHEMGIALEILRICRESMPGPGRLDRVTVAVGELSAVEPELLLTAWEAATAGEPEDGAVLSIEWHPAKQLCGQCGEIKERTEGSWLRLCPRCGMPLRIEGGDELDVMQLEYLEQDSEGGKEQRNV